MVFHLFRLFQIPHITKNLISVSQFAKDNHVFFEFYPNHCTVKNQVTKEILLQGTLKEGIYVFPTLQRSAPPTVQHITTGSSSTVPLDVWHAIMGHATLNTVKRALYASNIGVKMNSFFCDSCVVAKIHELPYSISNTQYMKPLEMIFIDIWGPAHEYSIDGHQYYISFVDACSKFTWLYLMHAKSQALDIFLKFKLLIENQLGHKIKNIQSDNAREFISFDKTLALFGIHHRYTFPYTHQQNGIVERKHQHVVETGLSLLAHASLPLKYWSYAFKAVVFIINNLPTSTLHHLPLPFPLLIFLMQLGLQPSTCTPCKQEPSLVCSNPKFGQPLLVISFLLIPKLPSTILNGRKIWMLNMIHSLKTTPGLW